MFAENLLDGQVVKFTPANGGWGVSDFHCYPGVPVVQESQSSTIHYTLGEPEVVWWVGVEYIGTGFGLAIRLKKFDEAACRQQSIKAENGWAIFYNREGRLIVGPERLNALGIAAFSVTVGSAGLVIVLLKAEKTNDPSVLAKGIGRKLTQEEVNFLKTFAASFS